MMKELVIIISLFCLFNLKSQGQNSPCFIVDCSSIDSLPEIKTNFGSVKQTSLGIYDTLSTTLKIIVKDSDTHKILKGVTVLLMNTKSEISDDSGRASFYYFGTGGVYTILISHASYYCIEMSNLHFTPGLIRNIEIKLKKVN